MPEEVKNILKETTKNLSEMDVEIEVLKDSDIVNQKVIKQDDDVAVSKSAAWHWKHKPYGV